MKEKPFKVAAAHASPILLDTNACVDKACQLVQEAASLGSRLLVFPEVFVPGFPYWINCYPPLLQTPLNRRYLDASIEVGGREIACIRQAAREYGIAIVIGISERVRGGGTCYNSQVFIDHDGELLGIHRKLQPTYAERYIWGQGDGSTLKVFSSSIGRIGGLTCWEHTMNLARQALILDGIQIHAASWPALSTMAGFSDVADCQIDAMMRNHAITGQCFVIAASNPVTQQMLDVMTQALGPQTLTGPGGGWSAIIHPLTVCLAGPHRGDEEKLIVAEIDLADIDGLKGFVDSAGHYARSEVLSMRIDRAAKTALESAAGR